MGLLQADRSDFADFLSFISDDARTLSLWVALNDMATAQSRFKIVSVVRPGPVVEVSLTFRFKSFATNSDCCRWIRSTNDSHLGMIGSLLRYVGMQIEMFRVQLQKAISIRCAYRQTLSLRMTSTAAGWLAWTAASWTRIACRRTTTPTNPDFRIFIPEGIDGLLDSSTLFSCAPPFKLFISSHCAAQWVLSFAKSAYF